MLRDNNRDLRYPGGNPNEIQKLKSSAVVSVEADFRNFHETMDYIRSEADKLAREATTEKSAISKKLTTMNKLIKTGQGKIGLLEEKVNALQASFEVFRHSLLTDIKAEYINVPATQSKKRSMLVLPWAPGESRGRKRASVASAINAEPEELGAKKKKAVKKKKTRARKKMLVERAREEEARIKEEEEEDRHDFFGQNNDDEDEDEDDDGVEIKLEPE